MARRKDLITKRNQRIRQRFNELSAAHPQWRYDAQLEALANEFYISTRTIAAILNAEGSYKMA